jgi:hypothetical protein
MSDLIFKTKDKETFPTPDTKLEIKMIELVNLQECLNYVVKVVRRDDRTLYGKIRMYHKYPDDDRYFLFDLGNGGGVRYNKCGRVTGKTANGLDIIWIKKIAKETENDQNRHLKGHLTNWHKGT